MRRPFAELNRHLDPVPGRHSPRPLLIGGLTLGLIVFALFSSVTHHLPFAGGPPGEVVRAEFADASQVSGRTPVRIGGVDVGQVVSVEQGSTPETSLVTMRVNSSGAALHRDAAADIRWRTILGGTRYIDLSPGSPSAPALGSAVIPITQTSNQVELDDITQIYDRGTAKAQRGLLRGLGISLSDPKSIRRMIRRLGPSLNTVGQAAKGLRGTEDGDLRRLVRSTSRTVAGLARDPAALERLVSMADRTLAVTDEERRRLGQLIELLPGSLHSTKITMRRLNTTLGHLDPLVQELRPGARSLKPAADIAAPALGQARAFLREAEPLLDEASPTLDSLRTASEAGTPLLAGLDPTVSRLHGELIPWLQERDPETKLRNYEAIGPTFSVLDSTGQEFNAAGHVLHFPTNPSLNSAIPANLPALSRGCKGSVPASQRDRCQPLARALAAFLAGGK